MKERKEEVSRAEIKLSNMTRSSEGQNTKTVKSRTKQTNRQTVKAWTKQQIDKAWTKLTNRQSLDKTDKRSMFGQTSQAPNKVKLTQVKVRSEYRRK